MTPPRSALVQALVLLARGDRSAARSIVTGTLARDEHPRLAAALDRHLTVDAGGGVYDQSAAFDRFISTGGNVELYEAAVRRVRDRWLAANVSTVLDLGCGDARIPVAVLDSWPAGRPVPELDLVDAAAALLADAQARLAAPRRAHPGAAVRLHQADMAEFLSSRPAASWSLVESTFAMHAIEPATRRSLLAELRRRVEQLVVVEFDVPALRGDAWLEHLVERYEVGLTEYDADELVAQGFLRPVLVGQVEDGDRRVTWEQPAVAWADDLRAAGFERVDVEPVAPYWWAPSFSVTAS